MKTLKTSQFTKHATLGLLMVLSLLVSACGSDRDRGSQAIQITNPNGIVPQPLPLGSGALGTGILGVYSPSQGTLEMSVVIIGTGATATQYGTSVTACTYSGSGTYEGKMIVQANNSFAFCGLPSGEYTITSGGQLGQMTLGGLRNAVLQARNVSTGATAAIQISGVGPASSCVMGDHRGRSTLFASVSHNLQLVGDILISSASGTCSQFASLPY